MKVLVIGYFGATAQKETDGPIDQQTIRWTKQGVESHSTWLRFDFLAEYNFFYKNLVYKNIKAWNGPNIRNILRTYEGFRS